MAISFSVTVSRPAGKAFSGRGYISERAELYIPDKENNAVGRARNGGAECYR